LENGFSLDLDSEPAFDLSVYDFQKKIYRCCLYLDSLKLEEAAGFSDVSLPQALRVLSSSIKNSFDEPDFKIFNRSYSPLNPLIMGIINVTPDSFYEQSRAAGVKEALKKAEAMVEAGADILDVGGQSTRPGSEEISLDEELRRTIPVVKELSRSFDIPISIDTYRREVAEQALEAGASIINDVFGLRKEGMLELAAQSRAYVIAMHLKGESPKTMQQNPYYVDVISEIAAFFNEVIERFTAAGGELSRFILDPGIGFGKRYEDNLNIIANLEAFAASGLPLLIGHSRKSFIGIALGDVPPEQRLYGTTAASALAVFNGASILRVHDVKEARDAARLAAELRRMRMDV
jgi:dihydropteroate synthase